MTPSNLFPREWLAIIVTFFLMFFLAIVTYISSEGNLIDVDQLEKEKIGKIKVYICGEVAHPGFYEVNQGTTVLQIVNKAKKTHFSEMRKVKGSRVLKDGEVLEVKKKPVIQIFVEGAVKNPGRIEIPEKTKYKQLLSYIQVLSGADLTFLEKRGVLKDQDSVMIYLKIENNDL